MLPRSIRAAQERQKRFAEKHRRPAEKLKVAGQVLISMKHFDSVPGLKLKLAPRYVGPVPVTEVFGPNDLAYRLELPPPLQKDHNVFHVSSLKKYHSKGAAPPLILPHVSESETRWKIDCNTDTRHSGTHRQYLVQWLSGGTSWELHTMQTSELPRIGIRKVRHLLPMPCEALCLPSGRSN